MDDAVGKGGEDLLIVWLLVGAGAWFAAVCATCAVLTAAKRADAALLSRSSAWAWGSIADIAGPYAHSLQCARVESVIVALQQPRRAGQVVVVAASGRAVGLIGRVLPPDDFVTALAVLSGRCERRERAAAAPLRRRGETIGAIGLTVPAACSPLEPWEMARLLEAADTISLQLSAVDAASPSAPPASRLSDPTRRSAAPDAT